MKRHFYKKELSGFEYLAEINLGSVAFWERYAPYRNSKELFGCTKNIYGFKKEQFLREATLSSIFRLESLYRNLMHIIKTKEKKRMKEINVVECGVGSEYKSCKLISSLIENSSFENKHFFAYDTFEGFPKSDHNPEIKEGSFARSLSDFKYEFSKYDFILPIKGIIPESFDKYDNKIYDFVHIDLDLYEGTYESLSHFFPRLIRNGIIQIDDYNIHPWIGANDAVDKFLNETENDVKFFSELPQGGAFIIKL